MIEACGLNRERMLPQLADLVTRQKGTRHDETGTWTLYEFDPEQAKALFGDENIVLDLFVEPVAVERQPQAVVDAVREAALARPATNDG